MEHNVNYLTSTVAAASDFSTYIPAISKLATTVADYIPKSSGATKPPNKTKEVWIDPICTMIALAILKKQSPGTKLSFNDNTITFDENLNLQFLSRTIQQNSHRELYNLTPGIYYSVKWLEVSKNAKYKIILEKARDGILKLIDTTYENDSMVKQYLITTHLRMLDKALAFEDFSKEDFSIPNHDENALNNYSKQIWIDHPENLDEIVELLSSLDDIHRSNSTIRSLVDRIQRIVQIHKEYLESTLKGSPPPIPIFDDCSYEAILITTKERKHSASSVGDDRKSEI